MKQTVCQAGRYLVAAKLTVLINTEVNPNSLSRRHRLWWSSRSIRSLVCDTNNRSCSDKSSLCKL